MKRCVCVCVRVLTWTVFLGREGFADIDVKAARLDCACIQGDPGAVVPVPDQVFQVVLIPMRIYREQKGKQLHPPHVFMPLDM